MKKLLGIIVLCSMFTGCAGLTNFNKDLEKRTKERLAQNEANRSNNDEPSYGAKFLCANGLCSEEVIAWKNKKMFETARRECAQYGFSVNSPQFPQCVQNQINSAKNREIAEYNARQIAESNSRTRRISCSRVGSFVDCTEH